MNKSNFSLKSGIATVIIVLICIIGAIFNSNSDNSVVDNFVQQNNGISNEQQNNVNSIPDSTQENIGEKTDDKSQIIESNDQIDNDQIDNDLSNQSSDSKSNSKEDENKSDVHYTFRNSKYLSQHFEKHGSEFDYKTMQEYEEGANRVILSENALHKVEKEDGDDVYYLEETNEFVILSTDGYIRTYFRPNDGIRYFNRQ